MGTEVARCRCGRTQAVNFDVRGEYLVPDANDLHRDKDVRAFLESIGWRFVPTHYVALDWGGTAGAARWECPFCASSVSDAGDGDCDDAGSRPGRPGRPAP